MSPSGSSGPAGPDEGAKERLESFVAGLPLGGRDATRILEPAAADLFEAFAAAGVDALLLKGAALDRSLYGPGERRLYSDIDLLICPAHAERANEVLIGRGYRGSAGRHGIDEVGRAVAHAETWLSPAGAPPHELDVHYRLPGTEAAPGTTWDALWQGHERIDLDGRDVPVPARSAQALQLATHAAHHGPSYFKGLRELTLAIERWPFEVWRDAAGLAGRLAAVAALAAGLRLTTEGTLLATELGLPVDRALEWEIAHAEERPRGTFHAAAFDEADTLRERLRMARRALFPTRRWVAVEYPWAERGPVRAGAAYLLHIVRTPLWAARAWSFRRRSRRAAGRDA